MTEKAVLLLRLAGPMQSWGIQSRFSHRDTAREPTKSGVIGLLCAALGRSRQESVDDLAALAMAVRVDREGLLAREFQTIGGGKPSKEFAEIHGLLYSAQHRQFIYEGSRADGTRSRDPSKSTDISERYYLADASFLVALGGDRPLLEKLHHALENPVWPLYLGRKGFVPAEPVLELPEPLRIGSTPEEVLRHEPWMPDRPWRPARRREKKPEHLRLILESDDPGSGQPRNDVPVSFERGKRAFRQRYVRYEFIDVPSPSETPSETGP